jgi:putative oxidoreductase
MNYPLQNVDAGKLIIRLTLGVLLLLHGVAKLMSPEGVTGIGGMLASKGLPAFIAYGVYVGEVLAPLMIILGIFSRIGGLLVVANMIVAISLVHAHQIFTMGKQGGWALELQGFYLFCGLALYFLGSGKYAVKPD